MARTELPSNNMLAFVIDLMEGVTGLLWPVSALQR
jgi:hypothetical protein